MTLLILFERPRFEKRVNWSQPSQAGLPRRLRSMFPSVETALRAGKALSA